MKLPIYFISDNHFLLEDSTEEKSRRTKLLNLFEKIKTSGGTLIIGGDFFDFWFETDYVVPNGYKNLIIIYIKCKLNMIIKKIRIKVLI